MQYSQEHLKTMVYAEFGGQTECIVGNSKIENFHAFTRKVLHLASFWKWEFFKLRNDLLFSTLFPLNFLQLHPSSRTKRIQSQKINAISTTTSSAPKTAAAKLSPPPN